MKIFWLFLELFDIFRKVEIFLTFFWTFRDFPNSWNFFDFFLNFWEGESTLLWEGINTRYRKSHLSSPTTTTGVGKVRKRSKKLKKFEKVEKVRKSWKSSKKFEKVEKVWKSSKKLKKFEKFEIKVEKVRKS